MTTKPIPAALDSYGEPVPHTFLDTYHRQFIDHHRDTGHLSPRQLAELDRAPGHYVEFFDQQLAVARTNLRLEQALTLADLISTPTDGFDSRWWPHPGAIMADLLRTGTAVAHHNERWNVDWSDLATVCQTWTPAQAFAVLGALTRSRHVCSDWIGAMQATGLWLG
ncbi:hypothetical protein [Nocardia nova]|uniref:hypothetical protein n=1 Tax=Nocardia nova TaxID=37330 RepID=UPI0033DF6D47